MAIKQLNTKGKDVLYIKTVPVAPILSTKDGKGAALSDLSSSNDDNGKPVYTHSWLPEIQQLVEDLMDTAESMAENTLGLASTQIWDGDPEKCPAIFIMRWPCDPSIKERGWVWQEFINPVIKGSGGTEKLTEGCLSYPGLVVKKKRKKNVTLIYQTLADPRQKAIKLTKLANGQLPHIVQHEVDHLNGVCIRSKNFQK